LVTEAENMTDDATQTPTEDGGGDPLISVVLPVYNGAKYLAEAIDSILAQTFTDFELIMIDDGSTDGSLHIMREYEQSDARVRVVARENRGVATTLNDSIDVARGEWLARMDQDDIALPYRFERQLAWLKKTGADISGSWVQRFGSSDKRVVRLRQTDEAIKMEMLFCSPFAHPSVMMRTALVKQLRYDSAWEKAFAQSHPADDYDLWERAAEAGWKMTNVPEVLLLYRVHISQISTQASNRQKQQAQLIRRRYWNYMFDKMQLNRKLIEENLKLFESTLTMVDMDAVEALYIGLLQHSRGESRDVILHHAARTYFKVAASCPNIISRWCKLNHLAGIKIKYFIKFKLLFFRFFRIQADGAIYKCLRRIYIWRASF
jgi:glycosyltransferase involved in cell wall biosynthesis